jgi:hypothetical protein
MKRFAFAILLFAFVGASPQAKAQKKDSVTVSVESLRDLKQKFAKQKRTILLQDSLIKELELQTALYKRRAEKDSLILDITEERLDIKDERLKMRDERIEKLEKENTWERIKKFIWTAGGIAIGFLVGSAG